MLSNVVACPRSPPHSASALKPGKNYNPQRPDVRNTHEKRACRRSCSSHASKPRQLRGRVPQPKRRGQLLGAEIGPRSKEKRATEGGREAAAALDTNIKPVFCKTGTDTDRAEAFKTGLFKQCPQRLPLLSSMNSYMEEFHGEMK